jgi:hypothetical protein
MTEKAKDGTARRPYQPPQLEQVQLVVEEAVLQMCKTKQKAGAYVDSCFGAGGDKCSFPGT